MENLISTVEPTNLWMKYEEKNYYLGLHFKVFYVILFYEIVKKYELFYLSISISCFPTLHTIIDIIALFIYFITPALRQLQL